MNTKQLSRSDRRRAKRRARKDVRAGLPLAEMRLADRDIEAWLCTVVGLDPKIKEPSER